MTTQEEIEALVLKNLRTSVAEVYLNRQAKIAEYAAHGNSYRSGDSFVFENHSSVILEELLLGE